MAAEKIKDHITSREEAESQYVPEIDTSHPQFSFKLSPNEKKRLAKYGTLHYKDEYAKIAYDTLANGANAKTKSHVCARLHISKATLLKWMTEHEELNIAVSTGLEVGAVKWRNKIAKHAFEPAAKVNNGLIKLLSANVYGIKDEPSTIVVNNNSINTDPEKMLKEKGIPIPKIDIEDIDE